MKAQRILATALLAAITLGAFAGGSKDSAKADSGKIAGSIVVLHHRTDWNDTKFQEYKARFNEKYPDVSVEFEASYNFV